MKLNGEEILKLVDKGYLLMNKHPNEDLFILNYSKTAQFEQYWNEYTLMARGLVVDIDFNVIARAYKKFFNYEEICNDEDFPKNPISDYEIYTKEDGSLGILFNYEGEWMMATRGSFTSDQAIKGMDILKKYNILNLDKLNTYLFEIIYPENLIVKNYFGKECLILHGIIKNEDGYMFTYDEIVNHITSTNSNFEVVKRHSIVDDINTLKKRDIPNEEGYVLRLKNSDFLMKLKFDTYVKLHGVMTNTSSRDIWKCLRDDIGLNEIIDVIPDEMFAWVKKWENLINENYRNIENLNKKIFDDIIINFSERGINPTKKDFALANLSINEGEPSIRFRIFENKTYDQIIWKLIEPEYEKMVICEEDEI